MRLYFMSQMVFVPNVLTIVPKRSIHCIAERIRIRAIRVIRGKNLIPTL